MQIAVTGKGAAVRSSAKDLKRAWLGRATARLTDEEREILGRAGKILKELLDR